MPRKEITSATAQDGVNLTGKLHRDFKEIASENISKIHLSYPEDLLARVFWDQQLKVSQFKKSTSMKWQPLFIKWCLYLRHLSGNPNNYCGNQIASNCHHNQPSKIILIIFLLELGSLRRLIKIYLMAHS